MTEQLMISGTYSHGEQFGPITMPRAAVADWLMASPGASVTKVVMFDDDVRPDGIDKMSASELFDKLSPDTKAAVVADLIASVARAKAMAK